MYKRIKPIWKIIIAIFVVAMLFMISSSVLSFGELQGWW